MKRHSILALLCVIALGVLSSCSKHDDSVPGVLSLTPPTAITSFTVVDNGGNDYGFNWTVADNSRVVSYRIIAFIVLFGIEQPVVLEEVDGANTSTNLSLADVEPGTAFGLMVVTDENTTGEIKRAVLAGAP